MKVFHPLSTAALLSVHIHTTLGWRYPADGIEEGFEEHIVTRELNCNRALLPLLLLLTVTELTSQEIKKTIISMNECCFLSNMNPTSV